MYTYVGTFERQVITTRRRKKRKLKMIISRKIK